MAELVVGSPGISIRMDEDFRILGSSPGFDQLRPDAAANTLFVYALLAFCRRMNFVEPQLGTAATVSAGD